MEVEVITSGYKWVEQQKKSGENIKARSNKRKTIDHKN